MFDVKVHEIEKKISCGLFLGFLLGWPLKTVPLRMKSRFQDLRKKKVLARTL